MTLNSRVSLVAAVACLTVAACAHGGSESPAATTAAPAATGPNVMKDLMADVDGVEKKLVDLAGAMPERTMTWTPGAGVRTVREVILHVASDNYLIPSLMGAAIPPETKIVATDFATLTTFEKQAINRDSSIAELKKSFAHLKAAMTADSAASMASEVDFFGTKMSRQAAWIGAVTHLHEHLGQSIAYARSNKVVPPWSK